MANRRHSTAIAAVGPGNFYHGLLFFQGVFYELKQFLKIIFEWSSSTRDEHLSEMPSVAYISTSE